MPLSGLDIYKLLPKTNCRDCGQATCLAFAMALAKKTVTLAKCPHLSPQAKSLLEASALPPIKLVTIGTGEEKLEIGNETVLFRHEEKFHHPCGLGLILEDSLPENEIKQEITKINQLKFERVGQLLRVNLIAIRQNKDQQAFLKAVKLTAEGSKLGIVLLSKDPATLRAALAIIKDRQPLIFPGENNGEVAKLAVEFKCPLVVTASDLDKLSAQSVELNKAGVTDLILDSGRKSIADKIWDLTQLRRLALKKNNRSLGYPAITVVENDDPYQELAEAATYISKYAGIVLAKGIETWQVLALLTLRQNIYTDPQKPLQIEPKLYSVGQVTDNSPLLVTTNFSLSYYTVLSEVETSKVPSYILSVDTEGMSVLTAWAAEKFNAEKITAAINKSNLKAMLRHNKVVIPGYVAVLSGDLEDQSGWKVIVGPKEAAGIPSFLKNLQ
jgi:acetyl-CoA decarbonylase/synthase complex subunit gamma